MTDARNRLKDTIEGLKQERDDLAVRLHLGKLELKEDWEKVTDKLTQLSDEYEPLRDAVDESASNVYSALELVAGEIKESFKRIRDSL